VHPVHDANIHDNLPFYEKVRIVTSGRKNAQHAGGKQGEDKSASSAVGMQTTSRQGITSEGQVEHGSTASGPPDAVLATSQVCFSKRYFHVLHLTAEI
jgi:hypothetical protein